jgi:adenylyltransferase/sulfurtransferase
LLSEALKYLSGAGTSLRNRLLVREGSSVEFRTFRVRKDPDCPACGKK